jgi:ribosome-associated protein
LRNTIGDVVIQVDDDIAIDENEIQLDFIRSSGPGGQNVNKVSTSVQLRFNVTASPSLKEDIRKRLIQVGGSKITREGILVIHARRFRTQEQNRKDAINRLVELIRKAAVKPKIRRRTKSTQAARKRRLATKRHRSNIKRQRRAVEYSDE